MMLWLPGVLMLLCGLPALLRAGQVDPRGWMWAALLLIPAATWLTMRRSVGAAVWASVGAAGAVLCCGFLAAMEVPAFAPTAWLLGSILLSTLAGSALGAAAEAGARQKMGWAFILLALWTPWLARQPLVKPLPQRPTLAVISGLPLFWREDGQGLAAKADAPIIAVLRQRFDVVPVDSPLALAKSKAGMLLLAQPRAFSMEELVALHGWISGGGKALILADPELRWPSDLPLGDRRRPPAVTLLSPMIEVMGVKLMSANGRGEVRHFLKDGRVLTLFAASGFKAAGPGCRIAGRGLVARCAVGKGLATIVADADLIDDRLWLADPAAPLDPARWSADTPQFVAQALGQRLPEGRRWVRSGEALVEGVRWAVLLGFFWAVMGTPFFCGKFRARPAASAPPLTPGKPAESG